MTDEELQLRRIADAADRARPVIMDPLLTGAFDALEVRFLRDWRDTHATDTAGREALWFRIQAVRDVRAVLQEVLNDGDMAKAALADLTAGITNP
jgi:hypothetical protein